MRRATTGFTSNSKQYLRVPTTSLVRGSRNRTGEQSSPKIEETGHLWEAAHNGRRRAAVQELGTDQCLARENTPAQSPLEEGRYPARDACDKAGETLRLSDNMGMTPGFEVLRGILQVGDQ